jgi:hypothetical protein
MTAHRKANAAMIPEETNISWSHLRKLLNYTTGRCHTHVVSHKSWRGNNFSALFPFCECWWHCVECELENKELDGVIFSRQACSSADIHWYGRLDYVVGNNFVNVLCRAGCRENASGHVWSVFKSYSSPNMREWKINVCYITNPENKQFSEAWSRAVGCGTML